VLLELSDLGKRAAYWRVAFARRRRFHENKTFETTDAFGDHGFMAKHSGHSR
jgi:hypothetical protein